MNPITYTRIFNDSKWDDKTRKQCRIEVWSPDAMAPYLFRIKAGQYQCDDYPVDEWRTIPYTSDAQAIRQAIKILDEYDLEGIV